MTGMPGMDEHIRQRQAYVRAHPEILTGQTFAQAEPGATRAPAEQSGPLGPNGWTAPTAEVESVGPPPPLAAFTVLALTGGPMLATGDPEEPWRLDDEYRGLPVRWRAALQALCVDGFDGARCARCGDRVGYYLYGDADEVTRWHEAVLVDGPPRPSRAAEPGLVVDPITWQCEACAPDSAPEQWPADRAPSMWWPRDLDECATEPGGARTAHVATPGGTTCRCGAMQPRMRPQVAGQT